MQAVTAVGLREALRNALQFSRLERFRDTGYLTTPNRLRFASEKWSHFGSAGPETIIRGFEFRLLQIRSLRNEAFARQMVGDIEDHVLRQSHPVCNKEYVHKNDDQRRIENTPEAIIEFVREASRMRGDHDIETLVHLQSQ